jgi:hypothetical protein
MDDHDGLPLRAAAVSGVRRRLGARQRNIGHEVLRASR